MRAPTNSIGTNSNGVGFYVPRVEKYHEETCEICDGTGRVVKRDERGRNYVEPCKCGLLERTQERRIFEAARIPALPTSFAPSPIARSYIETIETLPKESNWILFSGRAGSGKTSNASWIAIEFARRFKRPTRFYSAYGVTRRLATTKGDARDALLETVTKTPLVVFDDFLKVFPRPDSFQYSSYFEATLETIWDRYERKLPTVFTTQRSFRELSMFDAALAGRVAESCKGRVALFDKNSRNWRLE